MRNKEAMRDLEHTFRGVAIIPWLNASTSPNFPEIPKPAEFLGWVNDIKRGGIIRSKNIKPTKPTTSRFYLYSQQGVFIRGGPNTDVYNVAI